MKINPHNLVRKNLYELLMSGLVPRPIAFISTVGKEGIFNVAPFSAFAPICLNPPLVCVQFGWKRDGQKKDTLTNIEFSRDFVINVVDESLAEAMNQASAEYPSDVDEFKEVGLTPVKSDLITAPRVGESAVNMECKLIQCLSFGEIPTGSVVVIGEIILSHIKDDLWNGDEIDVSKLKAIGRLGGGGNLYCRTRDTFVMKRPYAT